METNPTRSQAVKLCHESWYIAIDLIYYGGINKNTAKPIQQNSPNFSLANEKPKHKQTNKKKYTMMEQRRQK